MTGGQILPVGPEADDPATIDKAAALMKKGGSIVFPTNSFYGLGVDAFDARAVDDVFRIKKRDRQKPLLILIAHQRDLTPLVRSIPKEADKLMENYWPGSLTLVFESSDRLPPNLTGHTGKIGIRLASHAVAASLVKAAGSPITATSANLSGKGGCTEVSMLDRSIVDHVDMVLDAGALPGGAGSSVVDVTVSPPKILREGAVRAERIRETLASQRHISP
jgi:L-threonylcarbamoyladenylate synthase